MDIYSPESIELKYCLKTSSDILEFISLCINCGKIPLPSYQSKKNPGKIYCKTCFKLQKNEIEDICSNSKIEIKVLSKLIISCVNYENGCHLEFNFNKLDKYILHIQNCNKKVIKLLNQIIIKN